MSNIIALLSESVMQRDATHPTSLISFTILLLLINIAGATAVPETALAPQLTPAPNPDVVPQNTRCTTPTTRPWPCSSGFAVSWIYTSSPMAGACSSYVCLPITSTTSTTITSSSDEDPTTTTSTKFVTTPSPAFRLRPMESDQVD